MTEDDSISISRRYYKELVADSRKLSKLEDAGVDNWVGYSFAFEGDKDEDEDD